MSSINRRSFLKTAAAAAAAVPLQALVARADVLSSSTSSMRGLRKAAYGSLQPVMDEATGLPLLQLPGGFRYTSFGWAGDPLANGGITPGEHDGMAAFDAGEGRVRLVRNHETDAGTPFISTAYDHGACGGTTTLEFDTVQGKFISASGSLSGTLRNCAGGPTPWGSWLTCEETYDFTSMPHGYVFEVPADGVGDPTPLRDMGRFSHEAVAVDPVTGYLYETEDQGENLVSFFGGSNKSGFYRFVPNVNGKLAAGGRLFMLKVKGRTMDLGDGYANGTTFDVEWVPIAKPDDPVRSSSEDAVWKQGRKQGAATFARLEGCWYGTDRKIYIVATTGGRKRQGQIWVYDPAAETISLLFESPGKDVLNRPDHITVSPRGGLVLCEDGGGDEYLHGLTTEGEIFPFALNTVKLNGERNGLKGDFTNSEWAGPCFSPDGKWLFANLLEPGITFAITGPWQDGAL
jgi:secreted PhoX family phosphatase